jgi:L-alanine-DL-glutamate epimerase-like enolase superfamily enzyme
MMPHSPYFGPGLLATLHITACQEALTMIEYSFADLGASLFGEAILSTNGQIPVPTGYGLGYDPDPDVIAEYRVA